MKSSTATSLAALALLNTISPVVASPKVVQLDLKRTPRSSRNGLARRASGSVTADLTNYEGIGLYAINLTIGTPPQPVTVQLDTGSSDLWVPITGSKLCSVQTSLCNQLGSFNPQTSSTFADINSSFETEYGDGTKIQGDFGNDTVAFGGGSLSGAIIGVASDGQTDTPMSGIMGIGYPDGEAIVQINGNANGAYPNIVAQMKSQGLINSMAYSLWLNDIDSNDGSILFGGVDTDKFTSPLVTLPVQQDPSGNYSRLMVVWTGLSFSADGQSSNLASKSFPSLALMDSGTTLSALPDDLVTEINNGLGVVQDPDYGSLLPCSAGTDPTAMFSFGFGGNGGAMINVSMSELLLPTADQNGNPLTFSDGTPACSFGLQGGAEDGLAVLGDAFLRSAYVVYDLDNNQIGLAQTKFNVSSSNVEEISGSSIPGGRAAPSTVTAAAAASATATSGVVPGGVTGATDAGTATGLGPFSGSATFHFNPTRTGSGAASTSSKSSAAGSMAGGVDFHLVAVLGGAGTMLVAFGGAVFLL